MDFSLEVDDCHDPDSRSHGKIIYQKCAYFFLHQYLNKGMKVKSQGTFGSPKNDVRVPSCSAIFDQNKISLALDYTKFPKLSPRFSVPN